MPMFAFSDMKRHRRREKANIHLEFYIMYIYAPNIVPIT